MDSRGGADSPQFPALAECERRRHGRPGGHERRRLTGRHRSDRGEVLGPRFTIASGLVDGPGSIWPHAIEAGTAAEAVAAVRKAVDDEADFLKIYSFLRADACFAAMSEARHLGLPVAGHVPARLRVRDVSDAGMRSIEHLYGMSMATSTREADLLRGLNEGPVGAPYEYLVRMLDADMAASLTYSRSKASALYDRLARNGTWQSPTLSVVRVYSSPKAVFLGDPRLKYIPKATREYWTGAYAPSTPEEIARHKAHLEFRYRMVGDMERAGVPIIGGTDCNNPFVIPGFAVHDELELLVRAGLTPMRALQTVTRDAAEFLGRDRTMGTASPGKVADLVVLDRSPLADIRNTQAIHSVITRGKVITPEQRTKILSDVEAAAGSATQPAFRPACGCRG